MAERTVGWSPNPNNANILRESRGFQASGTLISAEGRKSAAKIHTARRNTHILEMLLGLSALRSKAGSANRSARLSGVPTATATCSAAILQRHSYPNPDQGAHFLPGQVRLNGLPTWDYVDNSVARIYMMDMFADVERLPANFNRADTAAEDGPHGLKALAARCAGHIVRNGVVGTGGNADRQFVWNVYQGLWLPGVDVAMKAALQKKQTRPQLPQLHYQTPTFDPNDPSSFDPRMVTNLADIGEAGQTEWNNRETIVILTDYSACVPAGPSEGDVQNLAERAEAGIRGHGLVLES